MENNVYQPFIDATIECFDTMMDIDAKVASESKTVPPLEQNEICALLGLSGDAVGVTSIAFTKDVALKLVERFMGEKMEEVNEDVYDAVGEIINIIAGAAKAMYNGMKLLISLPSVMHGEKFYVSLPKDSPIYTVDFELPDIGTATLVISLKLNS